MAAKVSNQEPLQEYRPGDNRGRFDTTKAQYQTLNLGCRDAEPFDWSNYDIFSSAAAATSVSEILGGSRPMV